MIARDLAYSIGDFFVWIRGLFHRKPESTKWEIAREILTGMRSLRHSLTTDPKSEETKRKREGAVDLREKLLAAYRRQPTDSGVFTPEDIELLMEGVEILGPEYRVQIGIDRLVPDEYSGGTDVLCVEDQVLSLDFSTEQEARAFINNILAEYDYPLHLKTPE